MINAIQVRNPRQSISLRDSDGPTSSPCIYDETDMQGLAPGRLPSGGAWEVYEICAAIIVLPQSTKRTVFYPSLSPRRTGTSLACPFCESRLGFRRSPRRPESPIRSMTCQTFHSLVGDWSFTSTGANATIQCRKGCSTRQPSPRHAPYSLPASMHMMQ